MNVRDFLLQQGPDGDIGELADKYVEVALSLPPAEAQAALVPSVRSYISTVASSLRRARGGAAHLGNGGQSGDGGPAQGGDDSHPGHGGPAQAHNGDQKANGGAAQGDHDSQGLDGGPAHGGPGSQAAHGGGAWLAWLTEQPLLWVPSQGRKNPLDMTADEWDRRATWLENMARGTAQSAEHCREAAAGLRSAGVTCAREIS